MMRTAPHASPMLSSSPERFSNDADGSPARLAPKALTRRHPQRPLLALIGPSSGGRIARAAAPRFTFTRVQIRIHFQANGSLAENTHKALFYHWQFARLCHPIVRTPTARTRLQTTQLDTARLSFTIGLVRRPFEQLMPLLRLLYERP